LKTQTVFSISASQSGDAGAYFNTLFRRIQFREFSPSAIFRREICLRFAQGARPSAHVDLARTEHYNVCAPGEARGFDGASGKR
jgi:hypothetical protein